MATARQRQAFIFFRKRGWTPAQAAGIVGRLVQESGANLNTKALGDNGTAHGISQVRHGRFASLKRRAKQKEVDWTDFQHQLDHVDWELKNTEPLARRTLQSAQTVEDASKAMMHFMRPAGYSESRPQRGHGFSSTVANAQALVSSPGAKQAAAEMGFDVARDERPGRAGSIATGGIELDQDQILADIDEEIDSAAEDGEEQTLGDVLGNVTAGLEEPDFSGIEAASVERMRAIRERQQQAGLAQQGALPGLPGLPSLTLNDIFRG